MTTTLRAMSDPWSVRTLDRLVVFWVALWFVLGAATGITLWRAADLGDTLTNSGNTLTAVGQSLRDLSDLPLIPDRPGEVGADVQKSGAQITLRGQEVKKQMRVLGVLLGIALVGIPVTPILGLYLPLRLRRSREVTRLKTALREHPDDDDLDDWLAERARASLDFEQVTRTAREHHGDQRAVQRSLADAELSRLGLRRPAPTTPGSG